MNASLGQGAGGGGFGAQQLGAQQFGGQQFGGQLGGQQPGGQEGGGQQLGLQQLLAQQLGGQNPGAQSLGGAAQVLGGQKQGELVAPQAMFPPPARTPSGSLATVHSGPQVTTPLVESPSPGLMNPEALEAAKQLSSGGSGAGVFQMRVPPSASRPQDGRFDPPGS